MGYKPNLSLKVLVTERRKIKNTIKNKEYFDNIIIITDRANKAGTK